MAERGCDVINLVRCPWCDTDELYRHYHDTQWGRPCFDEAELFEMLLLEGAQAGLSWISILQRREAYRLAFEGFNAEKIARFDEGRCAQLMREPSIVRNRRKIDAFVSNAQAWLALRERTDPVAWLWETVEGTPQVNRFSQIEEVPVETVQSRILSSRLKRAGFSFVGPVICYAFMQAVGMVNDHLLSCWCHPDSK